MYNPKLAGFFPLIQLKFEEGLSAVEKEQFFGKETLEEKVKWLHKLPRISSNDNDNVLSPLLKLEYGIKDKKKSGENREAGNAQFYAGNFRQAEILYSVAVFKAPTNSNDLALALANRSACYQKLGAPRLALRDIDLALASGYPDDKAFKLYERKGECEDDPVKAVQSYQKAIKMIKIASGLSKDKREKFIAAIEKKIELRGAGLGERNNTKTTGEETRSELEETNGLCFPQSFADDLTILEPNEIFDCTHAAVEIRYEEGRGRYAIAAEDIEMGTTLFRETPLTYTLNPDKFGTHCQHCFKPIRGVVPCPKCTWVCFCSPECRDKASESYHKYECGIIKLFLESGFNVYPYLVLRMVCQEGLQKLLELRPSIESRSEKVGTSSGQTTKYLSRHFMNGYNLMAHEDSIPEESWILRGLVAIFMLKCLQLTEFFKGDDSANRENLKEGELTPNEVFVGAIIFRLLNVMPCNSHDIAEFETPVLDRFVPGCRKVSVGAGLYPCLALLNHSCTPSFMRCNKGNEVICVSSKAIKKGEEICENYGLMHTAKDLSERQRILKEHYKFTCICQPCNENWPLLTTMKEELRGDPNDSRMNRFPGVKCIHCGETVKRKNINFGQAFTPIRTCLVCGENTDLIRDIPTEDLKKRAAEAIDTLIKGRWLEGLELARQLEALVTKHFNLPVLELSEVQIAIWKCLWLRFGSMRKVKVL